MIWHFFIEPLIGWEWIEEKFIQLQELFMRFQAPLFSFSHLNMA